MKEQHNFKTKLKNLLTIERKKKDFTGVKLFQKDWRVKGHIIVKEIINDTITCDFHLEDYKKKNINCDITLIQNFYTFNKPNFSFL